MHGTSAATEGRRPGHQAMPAAGWRQALRTRLFELAVLAWSLPFGLVIVTLFQLWRPPAVIRAAVRLWSSGFVACARAIVGVRYRIEGAEHIPNRPVIFVCNHQSYWESIAFTAFVPDINVVTKARAMEIPVFGWGLKHAPMIAVHRDRRGANLRRIVAEGRASLAEGRSLLFFPEGTRVPVGGRRPYLRGLGLIYQGCGAEIVPVVHNAGLSWTKGFATKRAGLVTLRFLPPIAPGGAGEAVAARVEALLNAEKDRLLDLAPAPAGRGSVLPAPALLSGPDGTPRKIG